MPEKLNPKEILIIKQLILYPEIIEQSLKSFSPAIISNYIYELVKRFNSFLSKCYQFWGGKYCHKEF